MTEPARPIEALGDVRVGMTGRAEEAVTRELSAPMSKGCHSSTPPG